MDVRKSKIELTLRSQIESARNILDQAKRLALFNYQNSRRIKLDYPLISYRNSQIKNFLFSSTLNTVSFHNLLTKKVINFNLDTYLSSIDSSIINIGLCLYLIGGMNHLGFPQKTITNIEFSKTTGNEDCDYYIKSVKVNSNLSLSIQRKYCVVLQIHNKIVAIGGKNREACGNFEIIHLNPNKKNIIVKMTERKSLISACALKSCLYIVSEDINYIEKIDIRKLLIEKIEMNENLSMIYEHEKKLIVFGKSGNIMICDKFGIIERCYYIKIEIEIEIEWVQSWIKIQNYVYYIDYKSNTLLVFELPYY